MSAKFKDVIVSIATSRSSQLESWLLGHGFPVHHQSESADGQLTFYAVEDLSEEGRDQLKAIGAVIASEWKQGETQATKPKS